MRRGLSPSDLGDLLDQPLVAVLATLRTDGTVLLSPVYHEWRDGGFNVWVEQQNVKARHLRRDPRATILVAESDPPLRAVEVRGRARFVEEGVSETAPQTWLASAFTTCHGMKARRMVPRMSRPCAVPMSSSGSSPETSACGTTPTSSGPTETSSDQVADAAVISTDLSQLVFPS